MHREQEIEILKKIHFYVRGELSQQEVDWLWFKILEHTEFFDYLKVEVALIEYFRKDSK